MNSFEILLSLPLLFAFVLIIFLVIIDAFTTKNKTISYVVSILGLAGIGIAAGYSLYISPNLYIAGSSSDFFSSNMLVFGGFAAAFDIIFALGGILTLFLTRDYFNRTYNNYKELYTILLSAVFGMMCIAHSNNLLILFLGIETMSIPFYVLTGYTRNRESSVEGAMKYFVLGAFSSAFLLYGISMIYGATGTLYYDEITNFVASMSSYPLYLKLGIGLIMVGVLFKIAAFPFHQWAPDAYQAAPSPLSGFLSTVGKAAAGAAFIGLVRAILPTASNITGFVIETNGSIQLIVAILAALTMIIGNITALAQKNIKRMLAYSSIGHAGYMLMGIVSNNVDGYSGILYYSLAYTLTQIGAFAVISIIEDKDEANLMLDDYAGLSKTNPFIAFTMAMFMFSLAGIPPFAGFFGKYFLFKAAIESGFTWLTIIAVITSIVSVYYYLSVVMRMYFKDNERQLNVSNSRLSYISVLISAIGILFVGIFSFLFMNSISILF